MNYAIYRGVYVCVVNSVYYTSTSSRARSGGQSAGGRGVAPSAVLQAGESRHSVQLKSFEAEKENGTPHLEASLHESASVGRCTRIGTLYPCMETLKVPSNGLRACT